MGRPWCPPLPLLQRYLASMEGATFSGKLCAQAIAGACWALLVGRQDLASLGGCAEHGQCMTHLPCNQFVHSLAALR